MGVYEETATRTPGMHWQPHEQYHPSSTVGPAYDPSRDLSPNLPPPPCDNTATTTTTTTTTPNSTNNTNPQTSTPLMNSNNTVVAGGSTSNNNNNNSEVDHQSNGSGGTNHHHHHQTSPNSVNNNNHLSSCGADVCNNNNTTSRNNNNTTSGSGVSSLVELCSYTNRIGRTQSGGVELCSFEQHIPKIEAPSTPPPPPQPQGGHHLHHLHHLHHHHHRHQEPPPPHLYDGGGAGGLCVCAGCGLKIVDRFYLQAIDRRWHASCLQCCQCKYTLDGERTCFSREGNIYCRKDYYRLFGMKRCARCHETIPSSELVMRARDLVFHVHCFSCAVCHLPLTKGDHYGMRDNVVLCRLHFELSLGDHSMLARGEGTGAAAVGAGGGSACSSPYLRQQQGGLEPGFPSPEYKPQIGPGPPHGLHHHLHHMGGHHHYDGPGGVSGPMGHPPSVGTPGSHDGGPGDGLGPGAGGPQPKFFNGAPGATPRQKGRPRKRKPKDLEAMTANLDLNSDYLDMSFGRSPGTPGMPGSNQRTKRMRTSFKHHQLRTMKSYFSINHNPDAKDLKQLSQKTGLPKRVLQVWFQNARAKWRRMTLKQEGKGGGSGDKCSPCGPDGLSDLDMYPDPGSIAGSIQSLNPHSPQFMLPGSPSSLDCS